jgi:DNA-binding response OmpR family regulator
MEWKVWKKLADKLIGEECWKAIVVHDGETALRLLKMQNWDAVLLNNELPGIHKHSLRGTIP